MTIINKINRASEVKQIFQNNSSNIADNIIDVFQNYLVCKKVQKFGNVKKRGIPAVNTLITLLVLTFSGVKSVRALFLSDLHNDIDGKKDVCYRLKNNEEINWRNLLNSITKRFIYLVARNKNVDINETKKPQCLIADDTVLRKTGETIESIGKVFDHTTKKSVLGFKLLVLALWDGVSFIPINFSYHSEKGKKKLKPYGLPLKVLRKRFSMKRANSSSGYKRVAELNKSKIAMLITMIKSTVKHGFLADYVLVDKWFICDELISAVRKIKKGAMHILGPCKMDNRYYVYHGKKITAKALLKQLRKTYKRSRSLRYHYIRVVVTYKDKKLSLFFNRSFNTKNWQLLLTTNLSLKFSEAIKIYSIRWTIEVFFKEMKQHFNLGKCQSQNFDAQIADTTIAMIQYIMLTYYKRFRDYETIGGLFADVKKFITEYNLAEKIWILVCEILKSFAEMFEIPINKIMKKLFDNPQFEKTIFKFINDDYNEKVIDNQNIKTINNAI